MTTTTQPPQWAVDAALIIWKAEVDANNPTHQSLTEIAAIIARHAPAEDTRRLDWLEAKMAGVWHSDRSAKFVVQAHDQVCDNIGSGYTIRAAIDAAMKEGV